MINRLLILTFLTGLTTFTFSVFANEKISVKTNNDSNTRKEKRVETSHITKISSSKAPAQSGNQNDDDELAKLIEEKEKAELAGPMPPTEHVYTKTIFSLIGEAKYSEHVDHFDYANPNAPKGGVINLAEVGTFDNFNRFASRGAAEVNSASLYDTLFTNSADDITSYYPLIATSITYSDKYNWANVTINPNARFQDGQPITADDVVFTFNKFMTEGVPQYRVYNQGIKVTAIDTYHVNIELQETDREKLFSFVGSLPVIPKHFWQDRNFSEPLATPPIGSGPYYIRDYKMGQYVVYQRDPNYWAINLPVNKGQYNFDQKRIEYYRDSSIALEAFKAGEYDFRTESQPKNWYTQYEGKYFDKAYIIKHTEPIKTATQTQWLAFNLQKPIFSQIAVRKALTLAFDFDWLNHAFYYDSYKRPSSFFENTRYAATGKPSEQELKWLTPYKSIIPADAFDDAYHLPSHQADGFNRQNLLLAAKLLKSAGWILQDGKLINQETKQPFEFELLTYMGADSKYLIPFQKSLAQLGITMKIVSLDYAQMTRRLRERDYDMMPRSYNAINYPTSDLMILWGSQYLNSSWNASGLHSEAIDGIIAQITQNLDNQSALISLGRALDRILTHEYPMIPMWYPKESYYAYWNKFGQPDIKPTYAIGVDSWWYDTNKAATLPKNREH